MLQRHSFIIRNISTKLWKRRLKSWNIRYNFKWNQPYLSRGLNLNRRTNSLNSATDLINLINCFKFDVRCVRNYRMNLLRILEENLQEISDSSVSSPFVFFNSNDSNYWILTLYISYQKKNFILIILVIIISFIFYSLLLLTVPSGSLEKEWFLELVHSLDILYTY